jgi:DnaK suppressor protein
MAVKKKLKTGQRSKGPVRSAKKTRAQKKLKKKPVQKDKKTVGKSKKTARPLKKTVQKKVSPRKTKAKAKPAVRAKKTPSRSSKKRAQAKELSREGLLKKQLIRIREEIVKEAKAEIAKYIKGDATQLMETALDDGDWSVIDLSADINLRLLETHRESLLKIDESLRKLREGSYGTCEDCGGEISAERLRVMPFAIFCRDCQERREELEKVTREEIPG